MRNQLIYGLIGLMSVSLIGIIWIQNSWINDAISERERQFALHVNDALNAVNDAIDTDESEFILKRRFGNIDSLVNEVILMQGDAANIMVNVEDHHVEEVEEEGTDGSEKHKRFERRIEIRSSDSISLAADGSEDVAIWMGKVDEQLKGRDSVVMRRELTRHRIQDMESVVEQYTVELLLSGDLKNRISSEALEKKLNTALRREGISGPFAFAVKNTKTAELEEGFVSEGFLHSGAQVEFRKRLFPHDRIGDTTYELLLQPQESGSYVWSKVWKMTTLSIIFTTLILLSFGYALYFIYRQKRLSQVKNDFINNMTHELKTPLASISLATASIKHPEIIHNTEEIKRLTQIIDTERERINVHVERVLDTAALDSGEINLQFEQVDMIDLIERARKNVELSLLDAGGTMDVRSSGRTLLFGDAFHLTNALTNVLDNSIKYRSEHPLRIVVHLVEESGQLTITIADNGIGMSPREQRLAFEAFFRAETGDVHNRKGFGLGLSYVKGIVEKHRGSVRLSGKKGEGTTVEMQIPVERT